MTEAKPQTTGAPKNYAKVEQIAILFGKTVRRIQQLTQDGILPTEETPNGRRYDMLATVKRYVNYLEEKAKSKPASTTEKLEKKLDAEIKYKQAKADKAKLELDELKGVLHRAEDIEKLTNELVFAVRSMFLALPGRVAMDLATINTAPEVSEYLARHMAYLLDELAQHEYNPEAYAAMVREREGWKSENDDANDEDEVDEEEI